MKLATDIGGTFTDLVYLDETTGDYFLAKALSTPPHFSNGIMDAIHKSALDPSAVTGFVHGTTVVINALTERKGAKTALVTTEGCRDVLEIGRANRPDIYNLSFRKQPPFVPRELRFEVTERMNYKGEIVTAARSRRPSRRSPGRSDGGCERGRCLPPPLLRQSRPRAAGGRPAARAAAGLLVPPRPRSPASGANTNAPAPPC